MKGSNRSFSLISKEIRGLRGFAAFASKKETLRIDGIKDIVAVASGKGGVGKSTTAGKN